MAVEHKLTKGDYYYGRFPEGEDGAHKCPVCEQYVFEEANSYEICDCGWEDCGVQEDDPDYEGGANVLSLNQAREHWQKHKTRIPR